MHHPDHHHSYMSFTLGVLAGTVIGAGVALLYTPKTGTQMREDLADSVDSLRKAVSNRIHALADKAGAQLENVEAAIDEATEAAEASALEAIGSPQSSGRRRPRT